MYYIPFFTVSPFLPHSSLPSLFLLPLLLFFSTSSLLFSLHLSFNTPLPFSLPPLFCPFLAYCHISFFFSISYYSSLSSSSLPCILVSFPDSSYSYKSLCPLSYYLLFLFSSLLPPFLHYLLFISCFFIIIILASTYISEPHSALSIFTFPSLMSPFLISYFLTFLFFLDLCISVYSFHSLAPFHHCHLLSFSPSCLPSFNFSLFSYILSFILSFPTHLLLSLSLPSYFFLSTLCFYIFHGYLSFLPQFLEFAFLPPFHCPSFLYCHLYFTPFSNFVFSFSTVLLSYLPLSFHLPLLLWCLLCFSFFILSFIV